MEKTFIRNKAGILINSNSSAYAARRAAKSRGEKQRKQEEEIILLKTQLAELKSLVESLTPE
jgi:hypothetical protein